MKEEFLKKLIGKEVLKMSYFTDTISQINGSSSDSGKMNMSVHLVKLESLAEKHRSLQKAAKNAQQIREFVESLIKVLKNHH